MNNEMAVQQPSPPPPSPDPADAPAGSSASVERVPVAEVVTPVSSYNYRGAAIVGFIVGVVDIFIVGRFLGKLFGASSQSEFVNFIYQVTGPLVAPFTGIFGDTGSRTNVFETASLVAVVVYAVIAWGLIALIRIVTAPRGAKPATS